MKVWLNGFTEAKKTMPFKETSEEDRYTVKYVKPWHNGLPEGGKKNLKHNQLLLFTPALDGVNSSITPDGFQAHTKAERLEYLQFYAFGWAQRGTAKQVSKDDLLNMFKFDPFVLGANYMLEVWEANLTDDSLGAYSVYIVANMKRGEVPESEMTQVLQNKMKAAFGAQIVEGRPVWNKDPDRKAQYLGSGMFRPDACNGGWSFQQTQQYQEILEQWMVSMGIPLPEQVQTQRNAQTQRAVSGARAELHLSPWQAGYERGVAEEGIAKALMRLPKDSKMQFRLIWDSSQASPEVMAKAQSAIDLSDKLRQRVLQEEAKMLRNVETISKGAETLRAQAEKLSAHASDLETPKQPQGGVAADAAAQQAETAAAAAQAQELRAKETAAVELARVEEAKAEQARTELEIFRAGKKEVSEIQAATTAAAASWTALAKQTDSLEGPLAKSAAAGLLNLPHKRS
jgi:hypothetical protein